MSIENKPTNSILQIYLDIGGKTVFAQIMKARFLEQRRRESKELNFNLDDIVEGTEIIYKSNLDWIKLNKLFFKEVVKLHQDWRKDESEPLVGEKGKQYGVSYSFFQENYQELNKEIQNKLRL